MSENRLCPRCNKIVCDNHNSICCNFWFHLKCSGLKKKILRFSQTTKIVIGLAAHAATPCFLFKTFSKVCKKSIRSAINSIPCGQCLHLIHKTCAK